MPIPNYRRLPGKTELQAVDWKDKAAAKAAFGGVETDLKWNSTQRKDHLTQCYRDAVALVKGLEDTIKDLSSMSGRGRVRLPNPADVKRDRTTVKTLMTEAVRGETDYFNAMTDFRGAKVFGLPEKFEKAVKTLRGSTQTVDKAVARVPPELKALEARASAAIKTINVLLGRYAGAGKVVEKMEASLAKLNDIKRSAGTNIMKVDSAIMFIKRTIGSKDKKSSGLLLARAVDLSKNGSELKARATAAQKTVQALKTLRKATAGTRWNVRATQIFDEGDGILKELLPLYEAANSGVKNLQKEKKLDKDVKEALPKAIK